MRFALPVAVLAATPLFAACSQNAVAEDATSGTSITVTATDTTCDLSATSAPAGPLTFSVVNNGSQVTEFYLYSADGKRIIGEVENIGPGLRGRLVLTAEEGRYQTACKPGMSGAGIRGELTVTAPADGSAAPSRVASP